MSLSSLAPSDILRRIRYDPLTKKGSVLDVIQLITGSSQKYASLSLQRLQEQFPEVSTKCGNLKFAGPGQRFTPVAHLKDLIEIAWLCPGKHATEFRRTGAATLCRALGGDLSLVDEIEARHADVGGTAEQEALLAGTGVSQAEANGQAIVPAEQERRFMLENDMLEARVREAALANYERLLEYSRTHEDERDRLFFVDASRNYIRSRFSGRLLEDAPNEPITISEVAKGMGVSLRRGDEVKVGRAAAALFRAERGDDPPKHSQFVDGAVRRINSYFEKDRHILQDAVRRLR